MNLFKKLFGDPLKEAQEAKQANPAKGSMQPRSGIKPRLVKSDNGDEELSREFVRCVFAAGREVCPSIAEGVRMTTDGRVSFPINDDASFEISLAILGTALAILNGNSQIMTADRGTQIETFCRRSIQQDYHLPSDSVDKINDVLDGYLAAFQKGIAEKNNPFGETFGTMLVRCLGSRADALCIPGTSALNPVVHEVAGGLMTMTVNQVLTFWKGK